MGLGDGVSRDRVIVEATRRALLDDIRRARTNSVLGVLLVLLGCGIAFGSWTMPIGYPAMFVCGGIGLTLIPSGVAVLARSAYTISASWRRLRELEERTALPVARVRTG
jgi:hypothetical protein